MINVFSTEAKPAPKRAAAAKARAVKSRTVKTAPVKTTKHGREVNRLLRKLGKFEWDEEAMKRA